MRPVYLRGGTLETVQSCCHHVGACGAVEQVKVEQVGFVSEQRRRRRRANREEASEESFTGRAGTLTRSLRCRRTSQWSSGDTGRVWGLHRATLGKHTGGGVSDLNRIKR